MNISFVWLHCLHCTACVPVSHAYVFVGENFVKVSLPTIITNIFCHEKNHRVYGITGTVPIHRSEYALMYNDRSVLENHHLHHTFTLLREVRSTSELLTIIRITGVLASVVHASLPAVHIVHASLLAVRIVHASLYQLFILSMRPYQLFILSKCPYQLFSPPPSTETV